LAATAATRASPLRLASSTSCDRVVVNQKMSVNQHEDSKMRVSQIGAIESHNHLEKRKIKASLMLDRHEIETSRIFGHCPRGH
jgi:hypothetical protein